jgi:hypothetical protein
MIIKGYRGHKLYLSIKGSVAAGTHQDPGISDVDSHPRHLEAFVTMALDAERAAQSVQEMNVKFLTEWLIKYRDLNPTKNEVDDPTKNEVDEQLNSLANHEEIEHEEKIEQKD